MATIANLQIDLSARTARFSEGLQRAQQRVQQFSQRVQVDFQRVTQVGRRAALVFSGLAAALTLVTNRAADYAGTMDKVASQTGIAVEQIQELAFAVNQSNGDLASLTSGLRAFVRRTAEAAAGNTSFLKGFERLGFTQEEVRAGLQDIDGFLMQVADRVAELGTTAEQSAVLMTIMGDAGRRLVPFMAQGASGILELREQARELGLVLDEQAVRRLAAFSDRMAVLQERTSAARREMAVWFLPVMEAGVGIFEDIIGAIQDIDPALRAHAVRWTVVVGAVLGAVGVLGILGTAVSQAGVLLGAFGRLLSLVFSPIVIYAAIAIGAIALFRSAWENDWLGIRTAATDAWDKYIKPIWEALGEVWEWAIDIAGTAWDWLTETTWAEKVEDIKGWLTDGWEWLVNIAGSAWDWLVNTTWTEKVEDVRDWLKPAWDWTINLLGDAWEWIKEHLPWLATTVETLAGWLSDAWSWTLGKAGDAWDWIDQHAPAVTETIRNLRDWLSDAWDWTVNVIGDAWEWLTDTTWAEKVEDIKGWLTDGWEWLVDVAGSAWSWLVDTSWSEKIEDVRGWLKSAWDWTINLLGDAWAWIEEHLPWVATTVETLAGWLGEAWSWTLERAGDAWDWLEGNIPDWGRDLGEATLTAVVELGGDVYDAIKQGLETGDWSDLFVVGADVWRTGIKIAVTLSLAYGAVNALIQAIQAGFGTLGTAAAAGLSSIRALGVPGAIAAITIAVALAEAKATGGFQKFGEDLAAALAAGLAVYGITRNPQLGAFTFTIFMTWELGSRTADWFRGMFSTGEVEPFRVSDAAAARPLEAWQEELAQINDDLRWFVETMGYAVELMSEAEIADVAFKLGAEDAWKRRQEILGYIQEYRLAELELAALEGKLLGIEIPESLRASSQIVERSVATLEDALRSMGILELLDAIYVAEGGAAARVPYGATGFVEQGHRFLREANQRRFEELVQSLNLVEGTEDYYAAAAAVTVQHYWDVFRREFPEVGERTFAELAPEMQAMFVRYLGQFYAPPEAHPLNVNWTRNVGRILDLPGFQSGTPWTGWGPTDEVAGVVHRREAVIPWDVLRRGPAAVLEFLGAPGFQAGYIPADFGGLTGATLAEPDPGFLARLIESVVGGLESRGIIDPETARSLRELADNLLGIVSSLYDRAVELWDQLGQVDLDEYVAEARRFLDELEALGDVAEQERLAILDRIERLEELVEIERLVAETTGQAFDETAFRAQELSRAITQVSRQMFEAGESVEAITEAITPLVEQLEPLQRQLEAQDAVATAMERLAARLSEVDVGLAELVRSLRWEMGRGFRLDTAGLIQSAIGLAVDLIVDLFDSGAQELRQRLADVPDPGQDILSIADTFRRYSNLERNIAERQRLLQDLYHQQQAITTRTAGGAAVGGLLGWLIGGPIGAAIGGLLGGAGGRASAERDLRPQIEATERQIRELEAQIQGAITDLIDALGIAADNFASGIAAAFQEADITGFSERLRESVRDTIRQAMIQAFVAQVLEPQITALAEMVQDAFLRGAPLDMEAIDAQIESIVDVSAQLYDRFEELGLTVERTNEAMSRFVRNIPSGYRVERALFEVSPPRIPAMANGGIVTRPTLALVGEAGPEAVVPLDGRGFGTINIRIERMEVQDGRDFGRRLDEELRRRGLVAAGNVTAWRGRR